MLHRDGVSTVVGGRHLRVHAVGNLDKVRESKREHLAQFVMTGWHRIWMPCSRAEGGRSRSRADEIDVTTTFGRAWISGLKRTLLLDEKASVTRSGSSASPLSQFAMWLRA